MKAFDFDNTLYHGESSIDFAVYMIRKNKRIILWLPRIFWNLAKYKLCLVSRDKMEILINRFLRSCFTDKNTLLRDTEDFWSRNKKKLDRKMVGRIKKDDMIITAGPSFLFEAIKTELGTENMICSEIDLDNKCVRYLNFSDNKARRFRELFSRRRIDCFFTDSYNDKAMMDISDRVFLVSKGRLKRVK